MLSDRSAAHTLNVLFTLNKTFPHVRFTISHYGEHVMEDEVFGGTVTIKGFIIYLDCEELKNKISKDLEIETQLKVFLHRDLLSLSYEGLEFRITEDVKTELTVYLNNIHNTGNPQAEDFMEKYNSEVLGVEYPEVF